MTTDTSDNSLYQSLGASADKRQVQQAIKAIPKALFDGAFCRILPDLFTGNPEKCTISHSDSAGTKCIVGYLAYKEWKNPSYLAGLAIDATVMNLDDVCAVGAKGPFILSNTIARNYNLIGQDGIKAVIEGYINFATLMEKFGVNISIAGGETEDLGDIVRTISVGATLSVLCDRKDIINNANISAGDVIVAFESTGQATYEDSPNSGVASNGFTLTRHRLLSSKYLRKYPEISDPELKDSLAYSGPCSLETPIPGLDMNTGMALLSPTRTYSPLLLALFGEMSGNISGIIHNTGGGQAKNLAFGNQISYVKDNPFSVPPLFEFIRTCGKKNIPWREMFRVYNMGSRLEIILPEKFAQSVINIGKNFNIKGQITGHCESSHDTSNHVRLTTPDGNVETYSQFHAT